MNNAIPTKEQIEDLYNKGFSMKEIGEELGYSTGKIFKYFHIYNLNPRNWGSSNEFAKIKIAKTSKGRKSVLKGTHLSEERILKLKNRRFSEEAKQKMREKKLKGGIGHKKKRGDGYIAIYFPDHPNSTKQGYIMEHDLVMECYLGRWLKDDEIVHHINHKRDDNKISNLMLMTKSEHAKMHAEERRRR